jgi:hypothetical protein
LALAVVVVAVLALAFLPADPTPVAAQGGSTGGMGITRTTADIMAEQARRAPELAAKVRPLKVEREAGLKDRSQNPLSPAVASYTDPAAAPSVSTGPAVSMLAPQTVSTTFRGPNFTDSGAYPPDTYGDIGPTQYLVTLNGRFRVYSKDGTAGALNVDPDVFFSSVLTPLGGGITTVFTSDPRVRYDRLTQKWFIIIIDVPLTSGGATRENRVLFAVSNGPTITASTTWTFFSLDHELINPAGDTNEFADYPTLGLDRHALYIGMNMFNNTSGSFQGSSVYVIKKSSITGTGPIQAKAFRDLSPPPTFSGITTPQGVMNDDPNAVNGYFIGEDGASLGNLIVRRVINPGSDNPTLSGNLNITVPTTSNPCTVPHQSGSPQVDGLDSRLIMAMKQGGSIWTAHGINVSSSGTAQGSCTGGRAGSRWYEIRNVDSTPTLFQSGTVFDSATSTPKHHWMPSIAQTGQGHAAIGFSISASNQFIAAGTTGRLSSDAAGTMRNPVVTYQAGEIAYNPPFNRWGDYSYVSVDPCDNMTLWTIQEYVQNVGGVGRWGTSVAKLLAPPPADLPGGSLQSVNSGLASVNVTLTGAATDGRGFYDPGSSYLCRLTASATGGVVVNSVTYNSPTSITLNLNTINATPGASTVTITNPDGQIETGQITITVGTPSLNSPTGLYTASLTPTYRFAEVPNADLYAILVYDLGTGAQVHYTAYLPNCTAGFCNLVHSGPPLPNNKVYGWYAIAYDNGVWGNWSSGLAFLLSVPPTGKPTIIEPIGQYIDTDAFPTLKWTAVTDAFAYYILMYDLGTGALVYDRFYESVSCPGGTCSATPNAPANALTNGKIYGWFVIGGNYGGFGQWSDGAAFLLYFPPAVPTQVSTTFTTPGTVLRPNYRWNAVTGATAYYVLVQNSGGTTVLFEKVNASTVCSGPTCTFTQPSDLANGTYAWFVLAENPAGVSSSYSSGLGFTIPGTVPPGVEAAPTFVPPAP